jgi:hypothetical protein
MKTYEERIKTLPKWAADHIEDLKLRVRRAEQTIPWTQPGMEWFTIIPANHRVKGDDRHVKLFILNEDSANCVCSIGPLDTVFVGRGKAVQ